MAGNVISFPKASAHLSQREPSAARVAALVGTIERAMFGATSMLSAREQRIGKMLREGLSRTRDEGVNDER